MSRIWCLLLMVSKIIFFWDKNKLWFPLCRQILCYFHHQVFAMEVLQQHCHGDLAADGDTVQWGVPSCSSHQVHWRQGRARGGVDQDRVLVHVSWHSQVSQPESLSHTTGQQTLHQGITTEDKMYSTGDLINFISKILYNVSLFRLWWSSTVSWPLQWSMRFSWLKWVRQQGSCLNQSEGEIKLHLVLFDN